MTAVDGRCDMIGLCKEGYEVLKQVQQDAELPKHIKLNNAALSKTLVIPDSIRDLLNQNGPGRIRYKPHDNKRTQIINARH